MKTRYLAAALTVLGLAGPAMSATIVEYTNVRTGRYLLAHDAQQIEALESGSAGPGWRPTGYVLHADDGLPVFRFVRTAAGEPLHFFTLSAAEAASLIQPGSTWILEGSPFRAFSADASGQCPRLPGGGGLFQTTFFMSPVYRFFSGALGLGHRFVTSDYERGVLRAQGWNAEGVAFCVPSVGSLLIESFVFRMPGAPDRTGGPAFCQDEGRPDSCLAAFNLPLPNGFLGPLDDAGVEAHRALTGVGGRMAFAPLGSSSPVAASLLGQPILVTWNDASNLGLYLDSRARGASPYASLAPHYQLRTSHAPGTADERFFPWPHPLPETQLVLQVHVLVATLAASPSSHAYGHTTIEFLDIRSGASFYFNTLAYATMPLGGDGVGYDVNMGKPIVGTSFGAESLFGRSTIAPAGGNYRRFEIRIDRGEFQRIVAAARTRDPALSLDPADYLVANFRLKNETVGDARIGLGISGPTLFQIARGVPQGN